jgi:Carboxypeptidase regulatory-like domain
MRVDLLNLIRTGIPFLLLGTRCVAASSLSGSVFSEEFAPLAGIEVELLFEGRQKPQSRPAAQRSARTDDKGAFTFSDLAPGDYAVRVGSYPFTSVEIHDIHVAETKNRRLPKIILETDREPETVLSGSVR